MAPTTDPRASLDDSPRYQTVPGEGPHLSYNHRASAAAGSDRADLFRGDTSVYVVIVLLIMLVLPAFSVVRERYFLGNDAGLLLLIGKSFVFWGVGIRLASAGVHQALNPKYTAERLLSLKTSEPWLVVRELGFANIAIGTVALGSTVAPHWLTPAAVAGAIFYGLAGANHFAAKNRNRLQNVTLLTDLFACGILCAYCLSVVAR